jgi:glutaredoxin-related protein
MDIKVYTLPNCSACAHLKELMGRANQTYSETQIGSDITMEEFRQEYSNINMLPYVIIDGEEIGGLIEVAKKFLKEGLVTPPQK